MQITHNLSAMNAERQFKIVTNEATKSMEKLSSGYRINRAADNAAGLTISEKMRWQIRGLDRATVNCKEGHNFCQISDSAMSEVEDMLHRMRELVTQGANDTNTEEDREDIQMEINSIIEEVDRISMNTNYNEKPVFGPVRKITEYEIVSDGNQTAVSATMYRVVGTTTKRSGSKIGLVEILGEENIYSGNKLDAKISGGPNWTTTENGKNLNESGFKFQSTWLDFSGLDSGYFQKNDLVGQGFSTTCCLCTNFYSIKFRNGGGDQYNSVSGSVHEELEVDISGCNSGSDIVNRIIDAVDKLPDNSPMKKDYTQYAVNSSEPTKLYIYDYRKDRAQMQYYNTKKKTWEWVERTDGAGTSTFDTFSRGMDGIPQIGDVYRTSGNKMYKYENEELWIQTGDIQDNGLYLSRASMDASLLSIRSLGVYDYEAASGSLGLLDNAINTLNTERSMVGSFMNRLEKEIAINEGASENTQTAESRLRDTDMAEEIVALSRHNILQQAGQAMLAQANQNLEGVMKIISP